MSSPKPERLAGQAAVRVATLDVLQVELLQPATGLCACRLEMRGQRGTETLVGEGPVPEAAVAHALSAICRKPLEITQIRRTTKGDQIQFVVAARESESEASRRKSRTGVGRCTTDKPEWGLTIAALRAASHAGMLKAGYRANNQRALRTWSKDLLSELLEAWNLETGKEESINEFSLLEAQGIVLEHLNRVASAAVVTAANYPKPDSILQLFDTSAWLFDSHGRPRDAYTDTNLWLAWYPGVENDHLTVEEVIQSMPASPDSAIPWIVRLFENPEGWMRFRGAVDLEDHDVMHVLLGRGLQDQDEAFVIGFAMGTAKKISWLEYRILKWVLARLYPEPYRIPKFLQPAFDLGIQCGQQTGAENLYKRQLKELRGLRLGEARRAAGIDMSVVRRFYQLEQQQIPFTIASLRLP